MNLKKALKFSEQKHGNQMYGDKPYMYHINNVVDLAKDLGYDESIQMGCALHDVLEDTDTSDSDIIIHFGYEVYNMVWAVSDIPSHSRSHSKFLTYPNIKNNWKATVVKILDRCSNINQSVELNRPDKFKMYKDEHDIFFQSIHDTNHPIEVLDAWEEFGRLFGYHKNKKFINYLNSYEKKRMVVDG